MAKINDTPTAVLAPTEASPLLGDGLIGGETTDYSGQEANGAAAEQNAEDELERLGNPEMAKKLHLIVPAIGIGVSSNLGSHNIYDRS